MKFMLSCWSDTISTTKHNQTTGRCLRRALDHKVRKLRTLLLADEDISSELDRVVCRLMKLALHTSKYRQTPVPASWVQCKLFDLLTLTEKAIERRRKNYIQEYSIKAIENGQTNDQYVMALAKVKKENERADEIMFKYRHLVNPSELILEENFHVRDNSRGDLDTEDDNEFFQATDTYKDDEMSDIIEFNEGNESNTEKPKTKLDIVREWIGVNKSPLYNKDIEAQNVVTFKSDHESCTSVSVDKIDGTSVSTFDSAHNLKFENKQIKNKRPETKIAKKSSKKKLNYTFLLKNYYIKFGDTKSKKKCKDHQRLQSNAIAPIPSSLISLCEKAEKQIEETSVTPMLVDSYSREVTKVNENYINIAATENSNVISIITQETEEEVVLRRSIGTDPDAVFSDQEADLETVINVTKQDSLNVLKENDNEDAQSQTIFLYDINEPSTSKGIRHAGLDAQCGPDDITHCSMLSATTSFSKLPKLFSKGIKIEHSKSTLYSKKMFDTGTSPDTTLPHHVFTGIRINDSDTMLTEKYKTETATMTLPLPMLPGNNVDFFGDTNNKPMETTLIKPAPAHVQATKPLSDLYEVKSPIGLLSPINKSNVQIQFCKNDNKQRSPTRIRSKLSCGGIYVHSFKDKEVSEDVVFQGGWNELTPNALTKKNIKKSTTKKAYYTSKKVKRGSNTSDKNHSAKNELNIASKRPVQIRTQRQTLKKEPITKILPSGKSAVPIRSRPNKFNRNDRKVPPNIRESYAPKKPISYREYLLRSRPNGIPNIENYLPPYLKRNRSPLVGKRFLSQSIDSVRPADNNIIAPFMRSKTEEIKRDVVKRVKVNSRISSKFVSYQVFRNEIENKRIVDIDTDDMDRESLGNNSTPKRSCSPESQNSSDSSPSTVRAVSSICKVNDSNKTCTTSAHYTKPTPEFKSNFSSKIKNIIKKSKNEKKIENKENIPEDASNKVKRGFLGTTKNIFRAHMNAESSPLHSVPLKLSKSRSQFKKSPPKLPNIKSSSKLLLQSTTSLSSKKINNDESCIENNVVLSSPTDTVLISDSHKDDDLKVKVVEISLNNNLSPELIKFQSLENSIKLMLEEEINTICSTPKNSPIIAPFDDNDSSICIGNETLSYNTSSPSSFKTVIENDVSSDFKLNLEEAVYNSINNTLSSTTINIRDTVKTDVKSFESVCSSSKHSEYFLADQDLYDFSTTPDDTKSSLQGIFKRKDLNTVLNIGGPIALQAFSGFSMNAASLAGDQPEYISLVDPETRIMQEVSRQAESEEILISGRSSDTYESCYVEEDSFIPSWLFNIISHQQSAEESEDEDNNLIPFPLPLVERVFDLNADEEGAIGAGAGAGDGRGMHSDNSQDSSGRGTSLSSSETSTDTPSEAILVDPSALVAHYEYIRETVDSPNLDRPTESPDTSFMTADADNGDENRQRIRTRTVGSDIDADVSSLDTDAADSDI
ncbi:unnamed protein product [Leptosia nina]|uniref:Uncharacterized protein n=1 Tax=Leptosia nina TaxID=320188 RepID=A0AAV1JFW3_9NEOP